MSVGVNSLHPIQENHQATGGKTLKENANDERELQTR